jgi:hypothetical protein
MLHTQQLLEGIITEPERGLEIEYAGLIIT